MAISEHNKVWLAMECESERWMKMVKYTNHNVIAFRHSNGTIETVETSHITFFYVTPNDEMLENGHYDFSLWFWDGNRKTVKIEYHDIISVSIA